METPQFSFPFSVADRRRDFLHCYLVISRVLISSVSRVKQRMLLVYCRESAKQLARGEKWSKPLQIRYKPCLTSSLSSENLGRFDPISVMVWIYSWRKWLMMGGREFLSVASEKGNCIYSQTGCSFAGKFATFRRNIGILIESLLGATSKLKFKCDSFSVKCRDFFLCLQLCYQSGIKYIISLLLTFINRLHVRN